MKEGSAPPDDGIPIRCPRLGHQITFSYCRTENHGLPCFKALDCWHTYFEVADFLKAELTPDEWKKVFASPPKPKLLSLLELIEQAKKSCEKDS